MPDMLLDTVISLIIASLAVIVVLMADFRKAVGFFLGFCIFMAVAWVRLRIPFLGAAEICIGALMTGYVLWYAIGLLPGFPEPDTYTLKQLITWPFRLIMSLSGTVVFMGLAVISVWPFFEDLSWYRYALYAKAGIPVAGAGLFGLTYHRDLLRRVFAFNVLGSGVFLLIVCFAGGTSYSMGPPVFMVTTGLVVAFFASLMVVMLIRRRPETAKPQGFGGVKPDAF